MHCFKTFTQQTFYGRPNQPNSTRLQRTDRPRVHYVKTRSPTRACSTQGKLEAMQFTVASSETHVVAYVPRGSVCSPTDKLVCYKRSTQQWSNAHRCTLGTSSSSPLIRRGTCCRQYPATPHDLEPSSFLSRSPSTFPSPSPVFSSTCSLVVPCLVDLEESNLKTAS